MIGRTIQIREPYAPWSARISLFALTLVAAAMVLHRISVLTTPVAMNLIGLGLMLAALGLALGLYAATSIWIRGRSGAWGCAWGLLIGGALWLWPAALVPTYMASPVINDVATDTTNPPRFTAAARARIAGANPIAYPAQRFAAVQAKAYPDLKTLVILRPAEDVHELILDLVRGRRGLGWKVSVEEPPQTRQNKPGVIEASDRTLILGFTDDISIRIAGNDNEARVDIRSASRYGSSDFGTNATRIRRFVRDLSARLDAAGAVGVASRGGVRINRADTPGTPVKRALDRKSTREEPRR